MSSTGTDHVRGIAIGDGGALPGGVSSDIRIMQGPSGPYVVKQALEKLRVAADWHSNPARSAIEVRALRAIAELVGSAHAPRVLWTDTATHRFAMELITPRLKNWKQALLRGAIDLRTASAAGQLLGLLHTRSAAVPGTAEAFADIAPFTELRIEPFFMRVAGRNPALAATIMETVATMLSQRGALVHGDYSPKNLLVDGADIVILDCEVAHWGDPRFDLAFCVTHLLLKAFRSAQHAAMLCTAATGFLAAYRVVGPSVIDTHLSGQIACLLLARLEGDSPVDYLGALDAVVVKAYARELLLHPPSDIEHRIRERGIRSA